MTDNSHSKRNSRNASKKEQKTEIHIDQKWEPSTVDLSILSEQKFEDPPKVIKGFSVYKTKEGDIVGSYLAQALRSAYAQTVEAESTLSFYNFDKNIYVYGFTLNRQADKEKDKNIKLPPLKDGLQKNVRSSLIKDNTLYIKVRGKKKLVAEALIQEQRIKYDEAQDDKNNKQKQKKIGEVVQKVALWRKFYTGFYDENGNYIQHPLQAAATAVGIAKKTLDDYLLQIRNGKKYGFNFNEKVNCKIGELRAFVRDQKKKETGGK